MRYLLAWVKANPVSVGAIAVALISLVLLFFVSRAGSTFVTEVQARQAQVGEINRLKTTNVTTPPQNPDEPEQKHSIAVNQKAIDVLAAANQRMSEELTGVFDLAVRHNRDGRRFGHRPMVDGIFPDNSSGALPFTARENYKRAFNFMLQPYSGDAQLPQLNAGMPPTIKQIEEVLQRVEANFLDREFPLATTAVSVGTLNPQQAKRLNDEKSKRLLELFRRTASRIHIYAEVNPASDKFPFDRGAWSDLPDKPEMYEIWGGQMGLWIQQDIVEAIMRTNSVENPNASVLTAPVKRLIKIELVPGYIGYPIDAVLAGDRSQQRTGVIPPSDQAVAVDLNQKIPDNFLVSPTGRQSNVLCDVRHVKVTLLIDSQQLPVLLNQISDVNFMSIIGMQVTDVDEYEDLLLGFMYGSGDVVKVEMTIETIWLRDWTRQLMPQTVREALKIVDQPQQ